MITYITDKDIINLQITAKTMMEWVKESFTLKEKALLPHKTSITFEDGKFFNTMPTVIPELQAMGIKIVNRYPERTPTIDGQILYYNYQSGNLSHIFDASWITNARTGAVCAVAAQTLAVKNFSTIALIGMGNTAKFSLKCIIEDNLDKPIHIKLMEYKGRAKEFSEQYKQYSNVSFEICTDKKQFIKDSDIVISCITNATSLLAEPDWFKPGSLLIPVHTKGFQNCDLVFDKIIADDTAHVSNFKYFNQFKNFDELSNIITHKSQGRTSDSERIISYNIGIALHDIIFCKHVIELLKAQNS